MNNSIFGQVITFFVYLFLQVFFVKELSIFNLAFCFFYINFILVLPINIDRIALLVVSFFLGLGVDVFYQTIGIHSTACILIAFLKPILADLLSSKNEIVNINIKETGMTWFLSFALILIFMHHLVIFLLLQFSFDRFFNTLLKVVLSTLFTFTVVFILQYIISPQSKNAG